MLDNPYAFDARPGDAGERRRLSVLPVDHHAPAQLRCRRQDAAEPGPRVAGPARPSPQLQPRERRGDAPAQPRLPRRANSTFPTSCFSTRTAIRSREHLELVVRTVEVTPGDDRVDETAIDYNGPIAPDPFFCVHHAGAGSARRERRCAETTPASRTTAGSASSRRRGYSTPAVPGVTAPGNAGAGRRAPVRSDPRRDPTRNSFTEAAGCASRRCAFRRTAAGRTAPTTWSRREPDDVTPSNENDYVRDRNVAAALGKAMFWDMQVGSDGVQSCGTCHFKGAGTDTRTKNQINPNHLGARHQLRAHAAERARSDGGRFPAAQAQRPGHRRRPGLHVDDRGGRERGGAGPPASAALRTVCDAGNIVASHDFNDVVSSMGVVFNRSATSRRSGRSGRRRNGVAAVVPDLRTGGRRRARTRSRASRASAASSRATRPRCRRQRFNFDNFWDGRARHDFNGGSVFGSSDPQTHVMVNERRRRLGRLTADAADHQVREHRLAGDRPGPQRVRDVVPRPQLGQAGQEAAPGGVVTPLANQLVASNDSVLGPYSEPAGDRLRPEPLATSARQRPGTNVDGKPGPASARGVHRRSFFPACGTNVGTHLNGCYTDGDATLHPNQCGTLPELAGGLIAVLRMAGRSIQQRSVRRLRAHPVAPHPRFLDASRHGARHEPVHDRWRGTSACSGGCRSSMGPARWCRTTRRSTSSWTTNPDAFLTLADTSEVGLVDDLLNCTTPDAAQVLPRDRRISSAIRT